MDTSEGEAEIKGKKETKASSLSNPHSSGLTGSTLVKNKDIKKQVE
jgi:hypothetical protein